MVVEYCGQIVFKMCCLFEFVFGKVLFIDEVYWLVEGKFVEEVVSEFVDVVIKEKF